MAARQHSRFVHFVLPWLVAAGGFVLFVVTLNRWVSLDAVDLVSKVAGWDWNTMQLGPVTLMVTAPVRWLPAAWHPLVLNALSALLGGAVLGILAKCVALLPHDRTREQRQRERSDFSFLTVPTAWIPPVGAAALLAVQLTFWEHATSMTGAMIDLLLFALCVFFFLRFRVLQEDGYLACLAFTFGAAAANDWGVIGFCPLFFLAILWAKGLAFFEARFLLRTTGAGVAGLLFYLVQPLALKLSGQADGSFVELLRTTLGFQRQYLMTFPRAVVAFAAMGSILPTIFMGIRWPSTFGDLSAAGAALTNTLFRLIHVAFLAFCVWGMFDPPFSPRQLGFGLPFLHFYFLTALVIGYMTGYLILVFGEEPERKLRRPSDGMLALGRFIARVGGFAALGAGVGLAWYNAPAIRGQNGPLVRELSARIATLPAGTNTVLLSDDNALLMLATGYLVEQSHTPEPIPVHSGYLRRHVYQRHHEDRYGARWPALAVEKLSDPLADGVLLQQTVALSGTNQLFYLHPSFGFFFEVFEPVPTNSVYALEYRSTNSFLPRPVSDAEFEAIHGQWTRVREDLVDHPVIAQMRKQRVTDATRIGSHYARAMNAFAVELQRRDRLAEASEFFRAARELNPDNLAIAINLRFNENLLAGKREAIELDQELTDQLGEFRDLPSFLSICGPVDEPSFCFRLGRVFADGGLFVQAARQFARAVQFQPESVEMRLWLANSVLSAGLPSEVRRIVGETRKVSTTLTEVQKMDLVRLEAWASFRSGDLPAAEALLDDAQRRFPTRVEPVQTLNDIYVAANQTNAALATSERLIALLPDDPRPVITKSALQIQMGALAEAVQTLNVVLEKDPVFFPALVNRALAYSRLGRLDEAEQDYFKLREIAPRMLAVYYHLGEIDFQRRRPAEARRHYRRFLEGALPGSPEARAAQQRLDEIAAGKLGG